MIDTKDFRRADYVLVIMVEDDKIVIRNLKNRQGVLQEGIYLQDVPARVADAVARAIAGEGRPIMAKPAPTECSACGHTPCMCDQQ